MCMSMEWKILQKNSVEIIRCKGRLDVNIADGFKKNVKEIIASGMPKLTIDLAEVTFIDSSGLGALVGCLRAANQKGGDVKLCCLKPEIRMVIELTRLNRVFEIFNSEEETISSFRRKK